MSLIRTKAEQPLEQQPAFQLGQTLVKAAETLPAYSLSGRLFLSPTGFLLLSVPNALVRGVFQAMHEPGLQLPPSPDGKLDAHITVMRPEEIEALGGADKITERGKLYRYRLGGLVSAEPEGWAEMSKVWMLRVHSPELQELRRSYGLSSLPHGGAWDFHVTVACRRRGVLARNETSKVTLPAQAPYRSWLGPPASIP